MPAAVPPAIFLSYASQDVEAARRVYSEGHQYRKDSFLDLVEVLQRHAALPFPQPMVEALRLRIRQITLGIQPQRRAAVVQIVGRKSGGR